MDRATSVEMRKALEVVDGFRKIGLLFVAVPVTSNGDHEMLQTIVIKRLAKISNDAEEVLNGKD